MTEKRKLVYYEHHFQDFYESLSRKAQQKVIASIEHVQSAVMVSEKYIKHIKGTHGLYEVRVQLGSDIWRVFCFFSSHNTIVMLNGFQKKTQKTPKTEIRKAIKLKDRYENK